MRSFTEESGVTIRSAGGSWVILLAVTVGVRAVVTGGEIDWGTAGDWTNSGSEMEKVYDSPCNLTTRVSGVQGKIEEQWPALKGRAESSTEGDDSGLWGVVVTVFGLTKRARGLGADAEGGCKAADSTV